jgi:hypothetical protein
MVRKVARRWCDGASGGDLDALCVRRQRTASKPSDAIGTGLANRLGDEKHSRLNHTYTPRRFHP